MNPAPWPIVVVTPVKNEEWILDRFLNVTRRFADLIIIADQNSTDRSREQCRACDRVVLIENNEARYDEASRQELLIAEARRQIAGPKVILALDADEVVAADAIAMPGWDAMVRAKPGTVLSFEKPDLYESTRHCIRWPDSPWPLGFVDDGSPHEGKIVHSIRIPQPPHGTRMTVPDVKILHYGMANPTLQQAKMRYYSVIENINQVKNGIRRRAAYSRDWMDQFRAAASASNGAWFEGWEQQGIDMQTIEPPELPWHDVEVLRLFAKHGEQRFAWDDIWNVDWEARRQLAASKNLDGLPAEPIRGPGLADQAARDVCARAYRTASRLRAKLRRKPRAA
jgi:glycosyltransferase involved in cell wall biosynthesis